MLVLRSDQLGLGRYWLVAGVWFGIAAQYASQHLWKRASAPIAALVEFTWTAVVAAVVLTSATDWHARQRSATAFCVVFVTLLALHLFFAWLQTIITGAIKARRLAVDGAPDRNRAR